MDVVNRLNDELLRQDFSQEQSFAAELNEYREVARTYARMENALSVLSDMHTNVSYVFYGGFARQLGMVRAGGDEKVHSIWEEEILRRIHPDDLRDKYLQELRFFHFIKRLARPKRRDFYLVGKLRIRDASGNYLPALHRMMYIPTPSGRGIRFALCLYNPLTFEVPKNGLTVDSVTGAMREPETRYDAKILSQREKQVLRLIDKGMTSKQIADLLSISIHTVSRHRQQILGKLQVGNSIEACRAAKELGIMG